MLVVAHRGGSPQDIDNSADAFRHGMRSGADLLECDLQPSRTGELVLFHDGDVFGAPVSYFSTDELRAVAHSLMTFDEFVDLVDPQMRLVLDLKTRDADRLLHPWLEDTEIRSRVLVTSTFSFGLWRLKRRFPDLRTGLSRGATFTRIPPRFHPLAARTVGRFMLLMAIVLMKAFRIETAAFHHELLDHRTVAVLHRHGFRVDAWTVDAPERARELQALGVDYLTTNRPVEMISSLRTSGSGSPAET